MAEATSRDVNLEPEEMKEFDLECAICLQTCIHPAELPCGHIFCFLCVKGIALQSKKCALCRQYIPRDYIDHPTLVKWNMVSDKVEAVEDQYQWFYQGRNGWWQYDERTSLDLDEAHSTGENTCEILIAGFTYVIDFQSMVQYRKDTPNRMRYIKRDSSKIPKKGIAGLRSDRKEESENNLDQIESNACWIENEIPLTPSNTLQTPNSERHSLEGDSLLESFRSLRIDTSRLLDNNNSDNESKHSP